MPGVVVGDQPRESVEGQALGLDPVEETGELGGEPRRLVRTQRGVAAPPPAEDEAGEEQPAAQLGDRRRHVHGVAGGRLLLGEVEPLLVDVAEGRHARQEERPSAGAAQEGLGERAAGAPGGEQHGHARQREGIVRLRLRHQARGQRVDEGLTGRDGVDVPAAHGCRSNLRPVVSMVSTSLRAAGVPM